MHIDEGHVRRFGPCVWVRHKPPSSDIVRGPNGGRSWTVGVCGTSKRLEISPCGVPVEQAVLHSIARSCLSQVD